MSNHVLFVKDRICDWIYYHHCQPDRDLVDIRDLVFTKKVSGSAYATYLDNKYCGQYLFIVSFDMEEKTGIKRGTYSNYENGKTEPKLETWQKLASFFHVSVPYLQGFININIPNDLKFDSKQDAIKRSWKL